MKKRVSVLVLLGLCFILPTFLFSCTEYEISDTTEETTDTSLGNTTETETSSTDASSADSEKTTSETEESTQTTASSDTTDPTKREYVLYSDFGAKGNGEEDDFLSIFAAHVYANTYGLPVKADEGAVYLLSIESIGREIEIKTDTDWTGAKFIIDDRFVNVNEKKDYAKPIFRIAPSENSRTITEISSLPKDSTNIGFTPGEKCLAVIEDKNDRVFIRSGMHASSGDTKREIVLLDGNGNIDESTPLTWDYDNITSIMLYPIDENVLTIRGGEFHTLANKQPAKHTYFYRSISVERSNTVLENIKHTTEGETDEGGAPYNGFIYIYRCMNVTVKDSVFTPHYIFTEMNPDGAATFGYDIHVNTATDVTLIGCTQTISIDDTNYWGIFTSNFARNITMENCVLSRFDAHRGVYNVTIKGCTFGHQGIRFVGFGLFTIEDTTVRSSSFVLLRNDYGSSFDGKLVIRNCRFEPQTKLHSKSELISARNNCDHYYGYQCRFPEIEIDGLFINDTNVTSGYEGIYILPAYTERTDRINFKTQSGYFVPETIRLQGITTHSGKQYKISRISFLFFETDIITEK